MLPKTTNNGSRVSKASNDPRPPSMAAWIRRRHYRHTHDELPLRSKDPRSRQLVLRLHRRPCQAPPPRIRRHTGSQQRTGPTAGRPPISTSTKDPPRKAWGFDGLLGKGCTLVAIRNEGDHLVARSGGFAENNAEIPRAGFDLRTVRAGFAKLVGPDRFDLPMR